MHSTASPTPAIDPTPETDDIEGFFTSKVLLASLAWLVTVFFFVQIVDPYGVSPLEPQLHGFNTMKPARVDIDRLIKPYEVWEKQPSTLFMGTSRIHQSIDTQVLKSTDLAPAYNASVPANSLGGNISQLEQYLQINPELRSIFAELFIYNFLGQNQSHSPHDSWTSIQQTFPLFLSLSAIDDAAATLFHNLLRKPPTYEISENGNFIYPPDHNAAGTFAGFPAGIWAMHPKDEVGPKLGEASFDALDEFLKLASKNEVDVTLIVTPNHAYSDAYFEYIDGWDRVREWLLRVSSKSKVLSFSQPNKYVYEPVSGSMTYWNDPFHFSLEMGALMQRSLIGRQTPDTPDSFMVELTPENVDDHIAQRRAAIQIWMKENPDVTEKISSEHQKWLSTWQVDQ